MRFWVVAGAVLVAGCAVQPEDTVEPVLTRQEPDTCNAVAYQELIGQEAAAAGIVPDPKRVFRLGDPVTQDYIPNRVNVKLDDSGVIVEVDCG